VKKFKAPQKMFGDLDPGTIAHLVSASSDLALVLDKKGVIRDVSVENDELSNFGCSDWVGRRWVDVVTVESRTKVKEMLDAARSQGASNWRQVNHPGEIGADLPVRYSAIPLPPSDRILAIGRNLQPVSALQQRLVTAQAQMEQEYARLRTAETRFHTLFQLSAEPVIILDAGSLKIVEANPAASRLFKNGASRLIGQSVYDLFDDDGTHAAQELFNKLRLSPRSEDVKVRLRSGKKEFLLSASVFRQEATTHYLLRLHPLDPGSRLDTSGDSNRVIADMVAKMPDGFVVIDENRCVVTANAAFLELAQLTNEQQARGERIGRWLGRVEVDVDVLIANLKEYGYLRRFASVLRGEFGGREEIELSAVALTATKPICYGLTIRKSQPSLHSSASQRPAGRSFEQLKELVGQVSLRDLVQETTDIIEQMCIEAALELTNDNRASAAEMLGLSRQSLYVKLRRHGLGELDGQQTS
jgi:transcriptional regulator PpsR